MTFAVLRFPGDDPTPVVHYDVALELNGDGVGNAVVPSRRGGIRCAGYQEKGEDAGKIVLAALDETGKSSQVSWVRCLDGFDGAVASAAFDLHELENGDLVTVGYAHAKGEPDDVVLIEVDPEGEIRWRRRFGGAGIDRAWALEVVPGGGFVLAGETSSGEGERDVYVVRTDSMGKELWSRVIGGAGIDRAFGVAVVAEKGRLTGIVVAGLARAEAKSPADALVIELDPAGATAWKRKLGGAGDDLAHSVLACKDGTFLVTGYGQAFGDDAVTKDPNHVLLARLSAAGETLTTARIPHPTPENSDDRAMMSVETADGFATIGYSRGSSSFDARVVVVDRELAVKWDHTFERPGDDRGVALAALPLPNRELVLCGAFGRNPSKFRVLRFALGA